jgi:hypothetical protein
LSKLSKISAAILLVLLTTMALTTVLTAFAQDEEPLPPPEEEVIPQPEQFPPTIPLPAQDAQIAYVTILAAAGGTTFPAPGAYQYPTGYFYNLTAVPYQGFRFLYWTISGSYLPGHNLPPIVYPDPIPEDFVPKLPDPSTAGWDSLITSQNPLNVICGYGYNFQYQPVFTATSAPSPGTNTIVTLLDALGGSSVVKAGSDTKSAPGTYTYAGGQGLTLEATAADGYAFSYWIATGAGDAPDTVIVDNPADISCQEGTAYSYQPVFTPHAAPAAETGIPDMYFYAAIVVLVIIAIIGLGVALMYRSRNKK